jgi:hypothetical protein
MLRRLLAVAGITAAQPPAPQRGECVSGQHGLLGLLGSEFGIA